MSNYLSETNKSVLHLITNLGAKIEEYPKTGNDFNLIFKFSRGLYNPDLDVIFINPKNVVVYNDFNETILHEIIHWTGHEDRLDRPTIRNLKNKRYLDEKNYALEEAIAQIGMYRLACFFGLDEEEYRTRMDWYLKTLPKFDKKEAEREAFLAVNYLINPEILKAA